MRLGSLFAGIGGFDLAARWMGWETAWFSEIDPYASAVLQKHWPGVPNHGDITKIDFTQVEPVDMLCGGFPCQDISNAGKREGITGERSGLWTHFARAIREVRPRYVVVENVAALLTRGMDRVLGDLAEIGYDAEWQVLSAADVGAPHLRERVWIVAHAKGDRRRQGEPNDGGCGKRVRTGPERGPRHCSEDVADAEGIRLERGRTARTGRDGPENGSNGTDAAHDSQDRPRVRRDFATGQWRVEPDVGRVAHGIPSRVDRLRGLGNAIVPECAYQIFHVIQAAEERLVA